jgi:hypothetical protein
VYNILLNDSLGLMQEFVAEFRDERKQGLSHFSGAITQLFGERLPMPMMGHHAFRDLEKSRECSAATFTDWLRQAFPKTLRDCA